MVKMKSKNVVTQLGVDAEVDQTDFASATEGSADIFIMSSDLANSTSLKNVVSLNSIINLAELKEKLEEVLKAKGVL